MATHYEIRPLQLRILEILLAVDKVCREHNIRYYIVDGTLLGAIRHEGFIPWDDDLDIGMPRADYERFMQHAKEWLPKHFEAVNNQNDAEYPLYFAKVQDARTTLIERLHLKYLGGIYIDVFPLDGVPKGKLAQKWHFSKFAYYRKMLYFAYRDPYKHGRGMASWLPLSIQKLYSRSRIQRIVGQLLTKYDYDKCEQICNYDNGLKGILDKSVMGEAMPTTFENFEVVGPAKPHIYLSRIYGDYMTLPSEEQRFQHNFHFVDLNKPYAEK